mgnify:CR=1 FL=1|jgi:hypothetical protein
MNILIICLAQVLLSSILLFAYFKTRVSKVEEKLDIMFQLVQSHAAQQQQQNTMKFYENNTQSKVKFNDVNNDINNDVNNEVNNELDSKKENLISVSDDSSDDENYSSDSEENDSDDEENESDDEENVNELVIGEEIKKISLNLEINDDDEEDIPFILEKKDNTSALSSDEELNTEILEEVSIDNLSNEEEVDYEKFRVVELKKMCKEKELENYKNLKKSELIDLLKKN